LDFTVVLIIPVYVDAENVSISRQLGAVPENPVQPRSQDQDDVGV
jgi:hypothetical protein